MVAKSPDAFRTISEVAEWLDTPAHVLRFWESRFTQVKPVKRAGGRRYYRPNDMLLLGGIKKLLHVDGMTIKGAQKMLRVEGVKKVSALSQPIDVAFDDIIDLKPAKIEIFETAPTPETQPVVQKEKPSTTVEPEPDSDEKPAEAKTKPAPSAPEAEPETATPPPEAEAEAATPSPESPRPPIVTTPPDPTDESGLEPEPCIATLLRKGSVQPSKQQALSSIYNRLSALQDRMKASIDTKP